MASDPRVPTSSISFICMKLSPCSSATRNASLLLPKEKSHRLRAPTRSAVLRISAAETSALGCAGVGGGPSEVSESVAAGRHSTIITHPKPFPTRNHY